MPVINLYKRPFFIEKLNKMVTIYNQLWFSIFDFMEITGQQRAELENNFTNSNSDPDQRSSFRFIRLLKRFSVLLAGNVALASWIFLYCKVFGLFAIGLVILFMVKPSLLNKLGPDKQELQEKKNLHKIEKLELEIKLAPKKKQIKDLIDMSTDSFSFGASYLHCLKIWKLRNILDDQESELWSRRASEMIISRKFDSIQKRMKKVILFFGIFSMILSIGTFIVAILTSIPGYYYNILILKYMSYTLYWASVVFLSLMVPTFSIILLLSIIFLLNGLYNYRLFIFRN